MNNNMKNTRYIDLYMGNFSQIVIMKIQKLNDLYLDKINVLSFFLFYVQNKIKQSNFYSFKNQNLKL